MAEAPHVSVVIPTYKRQHLIARAVQSVLRQTYANFEVIVVNDGPPDGTADVLWQLGDERIRVIQHERNLGSPAARNTGIREARGRYIAFLDSDDEWLPEKLEKQVAAFAASPAEVGVVYTERYSTVDNVKLTIPTPPISKRSGDVHAGMLWVSAITPQTAMVDARCFTKAGVFDEALSPFEDWELWIRMSRHYHFQFIDDPLVIVHSDPGEDRISAHLGPSIAAVEGIITRHLWDFKQAGRETLARQYYFLGNMLCRNGELARGRRFLWLAVRTNPFKAKYAAAGILALFGIGPGTASDLRKRLISRRG